MEGIALCLSATGCLYSAPPAASALAKARGPVEQNGVGTAMGTPIAPDCVPCLARRPAPNPLRAYQSTVWPNRDGLLGLRRPPSYLNRTCIRAQGAQRLVARTAWPYCTWGAAATVCALSRRWKVPSPRAHCPL